MKQALARLLNIGLCSSCLFYTSGSIASAQVIPDQTVNTKVNQNGSIAEITGGETRGDNLFHSFQEFSIPTGNEAAFNNANNITNIFSRVTGANISNINGIIRANGSANLFLINPNGIIFGQDAALDIGGSFYGSTADSIIFPDSEFSATSPEEEPILTISVPIGLSFEDNRGEVINNSVANEGRGLEVENGNNITLVGGDVSLNNGIIIAPDGTINLGGIEEEGIVEINDNGSLTFPIDVARADVTLTNGSIVDVMGTGRGNININASDFEMSAGELGSSFIIAGVTTDSTNAQAGDITINASNIGVDNSSIVNVFDSEASGNAGDVRITASSLSLTNGGQIATRTEGQGNTGSVEILAEDTISIDGQSLEGSEVVYSSINSTVGSRASGNAGEVKITTGSLSITNVGDISAITEGQGNAGGVEITAEDTISIDGQNSAGLSSGIGSQVFPDAKGDAGDVIINSGSLSLTNGGIINASTLGQGNTGGVEITAKDTISIDGQSSSANFVINAGSLVALGAEGNAGDVTINTGSLYLTNGGIITASTQGSGNTGKVEITAKDTISIDGQNSAGLPSAVASSTAIEDLGDTGGVKITTNSLSLTNGGRIAASIRSQGQPGQLTIKANSLSLHSNAEILASTRFGQGGNVNLQIAENITLKNNSSISAQAFNNANGGNLSIDASLIIATPNQNNDLVASAQEGNGGNINITSKGIFGFEKRSSNPPNNTNDIDATSEFSDDGTVQINSPEVNLQKELEQSELELLTTDIAIDNSCLASSNQQGSFTIGSNDGLPRNPNSNYSDTNFSLTGIGSRTAPMKQPSEIIKNNRQQKFLMIPAQKMIETEEGRIFLVAAPVMSESLFCQSAKDKEE